jgi:hypothetical protein
MLPNIQLMRCALCALLILTPFLAFTQCWPTSQKLIPTKGPNTSEGIGSSIDYENNIAVVAAPQSDTLRTASGVVYIFEFKNGDWKKIASLTASDHREYHNFGHQVLIQNDFIFVGDPVRQINGNSVGAVYIYKKPPEGWHDMVETSILLPVHANPNYFGVSMDILDNTLLVGASNTANENNINTGAAFLFEQQGDSWTQIATLNTSHTIGSTFGSNVALGKNIAVVVADEEKESSNSTARGAVYVFEKSAASQWTDSYPVARLTESSGNKSIAYLGYGLAIDDSRNTIFVSEISWDEVRGYKAIKAYRKPDTGWANMTETTSYLGSGDSQVFYQTLKFEEPYLYSGGTPKVEIFTPDSNNEWTLTGPIGTLTNSQFRRQQQFGEDICVNNGRVLVSAPSRVTLDRDTLVAPSSPAIFDFQVPATGWLTAENLEERSFTYIPTTATDYFYGIDIDIDGDIAIVGSPYDNVSKTRSGAVYVYKLTDYKWNKIATLTPSDGEPYDNFGRSIAISDDHIAVGVENKHYRDETGKIRDHNLGAIYIYKKPSAGWTDMHENYKITRSEGKLDYTDYDRDDDHLGITVDLDYPYLIASRFDNGSRPNTGSVLVFNLAGDEAVLEATLNPSIRDGVNNFGEALVIRDSTIAIGLGTTRFWMGEMNAVFMYERSGDHWRDATESTLLFPSDNGSTGYLPGISFGKSIDMTEDGSQIIIGAPAWFDGTIFQTQDYFKGAAYIFERPPGGWKGLITEKARLTIPDQVPYACMGISVHIEDRYAVVGSPQNYFSTYGSENPGAGRAYFYQKPDDGWKYKLPDKIIRGDESASSSSDYFGTSVDGVFGFLMIGAFADDNQNGVDAGSVYVYTEYPFINPAQSPVCVNASPIQLSAVPGGGTWTGKGLANATDGIFYPATAGMGNHKIRYTVDGCNSANTLLIRVKAAPSPMTVIESDSLYFCGEANIPIQAGQRSGLSYSWSYSETGESYSTIGPKVSTIQVDKPGYYKVTLSNDCAGLADTVWVGDLYPDAGNDFEVCNSSGAAQLTGNYPQGSWYGPGISSSGLFDPLMAGAGLHELYYKVIPLEGCIYRDTVVARVSSLAGIAIQPVGAESFCYTGNTTLSVPAFPDTEYTWYFGSEAAALSEIGENDTDLVAEQSGFYKLVVSDGLCTTEASYQFVPVFQPVITPAFDSISFCYDRPVTISAESIPEAHYVWYSYTTNDTQEVILESTGSFSQVIDESGKFKLEIESHGCVFESDEMIARKIPADSVFAPNVITPNGDPWNEAFEVYVEGVDEFFVRVFNRYGQKVWSGGNDSPPWTAADVTSGVYFWALSYQSQCSGNKEQKGWVQVLKE